MSETGELYHFALFTPQRFLACEVKSDGRYTLILFFSGEGRCHAQDTHPFEPGDILLLLPGQDIKFTCEEAPAAPIAVIQFPECHTPWVGVEAPLAQWLEAFLHSGNEPIWLHFATRPLAEIDALFHTLYEEFSSREPGSSALTGVLLSALLCRLARAYHFENPDAQSQNEAARGADMVENVKKIIAREYTEPLSLKATAQRCYVTPPYLSSLFKQKTGLAFTRYLNLTRINCACQLLLDTDELVIDIAIASGFGSAPHFNLTFRTLTGFTPLEYRRRFKTKAL